MIKELFIKDFNLVDFVMGRNKFDKEIGEKDQPSVLRDLRFVILIAAGLILGMFILGIASMCKTKKERIKGWAKKVKENLFWNGIIRICSIFHIRVCMTTGAAVKTWI